MYTAIIPELLSLLLLIVLGIILKARGAISEEVEKRLAEYIVYLTIPSMVIASFAEAKELPGGPGWINMLLMTGAAYLCSIIFARACSRILHRDPIIRKTLYFLMIFNNVGNIAYPLLGTVYGSLGIIYATMFNLVYNILLWTLGVWILRDERQAFRLRNMFSPVLIAVIAGYAVYLFRIDLPVFLYSTLSKLGQSMTPAAMILIGCSLARLRPGTIFLNPLLWKVALLKQLLLPLLFYCLMRLFTEDYTALGIATLMVAMPTAVTTVAFVKAYNADSDLAAQVVINTTCAALPLLYFFIWLINIAS